MITIENELLSSSHGFQQDMLFTARPSIRRAVVAKCRSPIRVKPSWQGPDASAFPRRGEPQCVGKMHESSTAMWRFSSKAGLCWRHIERVVVVSVDIGIRNVRVISDPRILFKCRLALLSEWNDCTDLKPTENDMQVGRPRNIAPYALMLFHFTEPAKEKKDIAQAHVLPEEVGLCRTGLSQCRAPSRQTVASRSIEVGIQMHLAVDCMLTAAQAGKQRANISIRNVDIGKREIDLPCLEWAARSSAHRGGWDLQFRQQRNRNPSGTI